MSNYYIYNNTFYSYDEVYHHGIKGMKWGVRRFQNEDGTLTNAGKKRRDKLEDRSNSEKQKTNKSGSDKKKNDENSTETTRKGLTDKQKKAIKIGAAVVGTAIVAYGAYKISKLYKDTGKIDPETGFRLLDKNMTDAEHLHAINPGRVSVLSKTKNMEIINGSSTNCMLCTTAYEFRKRGFDVRAGLEKTNKGYMPDDLFPELFKNYTGTTKISHDSLDATPKSLLRNIEKYAESQGSGSRGNLMVWWKHGGGHSMIWENVDGKIIFKDGQTNRIYDDFGKQILKHADLSKPADILRTDNLIINTATAKKYMNTDNLVKTYVDHGGEIVMKTASSPVGRLGLAALAWTAVSKANTRSAVNAYREQHPNTRLSDKQIAEMLKSKGA